MGIPISEALIRPASSNLNHLLPREFSRFSLERGSLSLTCIYLRKGPHFTGIEIWEPGTRWTVNLKGLWVDKYLVVKEINNKNVELIGQPLDTLEEAIALALNYYLLIGS